MYQCLHADTIEVTKLVLNTFQPPETLDHLETKENTLPGLDLRGNGI